MTNSVVLYFYAADLRALVSDPDVMHVRLEFPPGTNFDPAAFKETISGTGSALDSQEVTKTGHPVSACPRPCGT